MKKILFPGMLVFALFAFSQSAHAQIAVYAIGAAGQSPDGLLFHGYGAMQSTLAVAAYYNVYQETYLYDNGTAVAAQGYLGFDTGSSI